MQDKLAKQVKSPTTAAAVPAVAAAKGLSETLIEQAFAFFQFIALCRTRSCAYIQRWRLHRSHARTLTSLCLVL